LSVDLAHMRSGASLLETEIPQQGDLLRRVLQDRAPLVRDTVAALVAGEPSSWLVAGCGDSLFAGMAGEYWFAAHAQTPLRPLHALAFSRYLYHSVDDRGVVFAVSYSGNTARVVEAAVAAKSRGATVVAITANEDSRLVELADYWLPNDALAERSNCRTLSFQAACALMHMTAAEIGGRGRPDTAIADAVDALTASSAEPVAAFVEALPDELDFTVIGGGFAFPAACYGAAKLYEAATIPAHVAELEQFIHCEIFTVTKQSCLVLIAPSGASYARAVEVADGLAKLGATTLGISDEPEFAQHVSQLVELPAGLGESALPYLAAIPLQYFALDLALRRGENPDLVSNKPVNRPLIESPLAWTQVDYEEAR
jgi:glucosamine--fructose-6-phosphate aminotransferase (isomerizing)